MPVKQLTRGTVTNNSRGLRLGRLVGDPQYHLRGNGEGVPRRADCAAGDGQRGQPRQQGAARLREVGEDIATPYGAPHRLRGLAAAGTVGAAAALADRFLLSLARRRGDLVQPDPRRSVRPRLHLRRPREFLRAVRRSAVCRFDHPHGDLLRCRQPAVDERRTAARRVCRPRTSRGGRFTARC